MTIGAIVLVQTGSSLFLPISEDLEQAITEIRVEQHLDDQTTFAIRFQEDFTDSQAQTSGHEQLQRHRGIAILVPKHRDSDELVCLVRGQIEQSDFDVAIGGVGSSFEIRGHDIRTLIDRRAESIEFTGSSEQIMNQITATLGEGAVSVAPGAFDFDTDDEMYRCRGSFLDALESLAQRSNLNFWITYSPSRKSVFAVEGPAPEVWSVDFTINIQPSPPRKQESKPGPDVPLDQLVLVDEKTPRLVILSADENETVVNFRVSTDWETVTRAEGFAIDREGSEPEEIRVNTPPDDPTNESGRPPSESDDPDARTIQPAIPGQPSFNRKAAEAAVTEGNWFIKAETLTTAHMLGSVVVPHDLVRVVGAGCEAAGVYQVRDAVHVINPAEHWMELELRTNSLPKEQGNAKA